MDFLLHSWSTPFYVKRPLKHTNPFQMNVVGREKIRLQAKNENWLKWAFWHFAKTFTHVFHSTGGSNHSSVFTDARANDVAISMWCLSVAHCFDEQFDWISSYRLCVSIIKVPRFIDWSDFMNSTENIHWRHTVWCSEAIILTLLLIVRLPAHQLLTFHMIFCLSAAYVILIDCDGSICTNIRFVASAYRRQMVVQKRNIMNRALWTIKWIYRFSMALAHLFITNAHHSDDILLSNDSITALLRTLALCQGMKIIVLKKEKKNQTGETFAKDVNNPIVCYLFSQKATD